MKKEILIKTLYLSGLSGPEIAKKLNVSKDFVYKKLGSSDVKILNARARLDLKPLSFNYKKVLNLFDQKLELAALMLYLGEGAKTGKTVDFANSDLRLLRIFLSYLRSICRVSEKKLRVYLYCHDTKNPNSLILYWSKELKIPVEQFTKPYIKRSDNKNDKMQYGLVHIRYNDKRLLEKILLLCSDIAASILDPWADTQVANEGRLSKGSS